MKTSKDTKGRMKLDEIKPKYRPSEVDMKRFKYEALLGLHSKLKASLEYRISYFHYTIVEK